MDVLDIKLTDEVLDKMYTACRRPASIRKIMLNAIRDKRGLLRKVEQKTGRYEKVRYNLMEQEYAAAMAILTTHESGMQLFIQVLHELGESRAVKIFQKAYDNEPDAFAPDKLVTNSVECSGIMDEVKDDETLQNLIKIMIARNILDRSEVSNEREFAQLKQMIVTKMKSLTEDKFDCLYHDLQYVVGGRKLHDTLRFAYYSVGSISDLLN